MLEGMLNFGQHDGPTVFDWRASESRFGPKAQCWNMLEPGSNEQNPWWFDGDIYDIYIYTLYGFSMF